MHYMMLTRICLAFLYVTGSLSRDTCLQSCGHILFLLCTQWLLKLLQVGPTFGRRMMTGYLAAHGTHVAEQRVQAALRAINLPYHRERREVFFCSYGCSVLIIC